LAQLLDRYEPGFAAFPTSGGDVDALVATVLEAGFTVRPTSEGTYSLVKSGGPVGDFSRTASDFDFHTDGLYYEQPPDYVVLHCVDPGRGSCTTLLSDTIAAFASLTPADQGLAHRLAGVYIGRDGREYTHPLVRKHPTTGGAAIQTPSRGYIKPLALVPAEGGQVSVRDITKFSDRLLAAFEDTIRTDQSWTAGDLLVFDNTRYVHARRCGGSSDHTRLLHRLWLDRWGSTAAAA